MRLTDLTYSDWLEHAFGREVRIQQPAWFFGSAKKPFS